VLDGAALRKICLRRAEILDQDGKMMVKLVRLFR
jgi:hypothetical protein